MTTVSLAERLPLALRELVRNDGQLPPFLAAEQVVSLSKQLLCTPAQLAEALLPYAARFSHAPRSQFHVGAVALMNDNAMFFGANYELDYGPLTTALHAEQSAIFNALSQHDGYIEMLVITAAPCGYCRQFIQELSNARELKLRFNNQQFLFNALLPSAFGPHDLGISQALAARHVTQDANGETFAEASYSPYSKVKSALLAYNGEQMLAWSCYFENAAYNPSMSPLPALLSQLRLHGHALSSITRIALWEPENQLFSFQPELEQFIKHINNIELSFHPYQHGETQ